MQLLTIYLRNFRAFQEALFEFSPAVNKIWGPNARGKTTILEAIHFLIAARSFRPGKLGGLIRQGERYFLLEAAFLKHGIRQTLRISFDGKEKKIVYNNTVLPSPSGLIGLLQGVVSSPDDSVLIKGTPSDRRQFLDLQIAQADPLYMHYLTRYHRAMRQRNALLKARCTTGIEAWEKEMANAAAYVIEKRYQTVDSLKEQLSEKHRILSSDDIEAGLTYRSAAGKSLKGAAISSYYLEQYQRLRKRETEWGITLAGPHKDDLTMDIGGQDVRYFASEGQKRGYVSALRLAEWKRLSGLADGPPMLLLDDIGVSLDDDRQQRLYQCLPQSGQIFLTSTRQPAVEGKEIRV